VGWGGVLENGRGGGRRKKVSWGFKLKRDDFFCALGKRRWVGRCKNTVRWVAGGKDTAAPRRAGQQTGGWVFEQGDRWGSTRMNEPEY